MKTLKGGAKYPTVGLAIALLLTLLGACGRDLPASSPDDLQCVGPGGRCSFDNQCCSHRCNAETDCAGGTP
jgi:hypothetical protein